MDDVMLRCFLSSSKRSLLDVTKAISSPEKKAEKTSVKIIKDIVFKIRTQKLLHCK